MAVRSRKPYSTPKRTTRNKKSDNKKLDVTTRIRVDEIRLNDSDSLDTSFLEGRVERQSRKNTKKVTENILKDNSDKIRKLKIIKRLFFTIALVMCIILLIILLINFIKKIDFSKKSNTTNTDIVQKKETKDIDDNFLFVGDFGTEEFNFDNFDLDYHYVKKTDKKLTTEKLNDDLNDYVYKYNPSVIFLQVGIIDLDEDKSIDEIIDNYGKIIDSIKENRSYAEIYIESLYPINRDIDDFDDDIIKSDIDNDDIKKLNSRLKKLAEEKKVKYIDLFSALENKGKLDEIYTDNGSLLNDDGYKQVYKYIIKYTKDN